MKILAWLAILAIFLLSLLFSLLNPSPVPFDYLLGQQDMPLSLLLILAFVLGLTLGLSAMTLLIWRAKHKARAMSTQLLHAKKELENLRTVAILGD